MATVTVLSAYASDDLPEIVALQHRLVPDHGRWTPEQAQSELCDIARGHGANVLVARTGGVITGVLGWVALGVAEGHFYGAPFLAADEATATLLVEALVARARQTPAVWIRSGGLPEEEVKLRVLARAGFVKVLEFVSLRLPLGGLLEPPTDFAGLRSVARETIDPARFAKLFNACFRDVPNSPAIDTELARDTWENPLIWPEASLLLADEHGRYQAFLTVRRDGFIEVVGVDEAMRGRGVARALMQRVIAMATAQGLPALTSLCASSNLPSMDLHHALGFVEVARRQSWQLDLASAPA